MQLRIDRSRHGVGVSLYIRDDLKFIPRNDIPKSNLELLCIEVQPHKSKSFLVLAWYRPQNDHITTFHRVENVLPYIDREGKEMILMGDTNSYLCKDSIHHPLYSNSRNIRNLYECVIQSAANLYTH